MSGHSSSIMNILDRQYLCWYIRRQGCQRSIFKGEFSQAMLTILITLLRYLNSASRHDQGGANPARKFCLLSGVDMDAFKHG